MGLQLNIFNSSLEQIIRSLMPRMSFARVSIADTSLLGAPLFSGVALDEAWTTEMFGAQQSS